MKVTIEALPDRDWVLARWCDSRGQFPNVTLTVSTDPDRPGPNAPVQIAAGVGHARLPRIGLRTYVHVTANGSGPTIVAGERVVALPGVQNLRDLGGYHSSNDRVIRWGRLYRSEAVTSHAGNTVSKSADNASSNGAGESLGIGARIDARALACVAELGLRTVIDLRTSAEAVAVPTVWLRGGVEKAISAPIPDPAGFAGRLAGFIEDGLLTRYSTEDLARDYRVMLDRHPAAFGTAISAVARASGRPVLVHCAGGKDRTGLVIALILSLLGVSRETILEDYAMTTRCRPNAIDAYASLLERVGVRGEDIAGVFSSDASVLAAALEHVDDGHGSVARYLRGPCGVSAAAVERLERTLLAPAT
jgi:protein-tyrosine phosphatase